MTARLVLSSGRSTVRPWLLLPLLAPLALAACPIGRETASLGPEDGVDTGGGTNGRCATDPDCATAAATCCECPAFAVSVGDPAHRACAGVICPPQETCPANVRAACDQGTCVLACVELACPLSCDAGFVMDPTGCLSCACAAPDLGGCQQDGDCVETRADCCGCQHGGMDTAVVRGTEAAFDAALGCPPSPACPSVDICEPGAAPRCVQGRCELVSGAGLPAGACGRPDLPVCPSGTVCTVNRDPLASLLGVGVCVPQP